MVFHLVSCTRKRLLYSTVNPLLDTVQVFMKQIFTLPVVFYKMQNSSHLRPIIRCYDGANVCYEVGFSLFYFLGTGSPGFIWMTLSI